MIKIQNLTKTFGQKKALDNISFNIDAASVFGLVGSNVPRYEQKTLSIT